VKQSCSGMPYVPKWEQQEKQRERESDCQFLKRSLLLEVSSSVHFTRGFMQLSGVIQANE
jgi:hypothetical protein